MAPKRRTRSVDHEKDQAKKHVAPPPPSSSSSDEDKGELTVGLNEKQLAKFREIFEKFREKNKRATLCVMWDNIEPGQNVPLPSAEEYEADRWTSKLGGYPFWPADEKKYPYKRDVKKDLKDVNNFGDLQLLVQLNLSEIAVEGKTLKEALTILQLPSDGGILQFFVQPNDTMGLFDDSGAFVRDPSATGFRVRYWPKSVVEECQKKKKGQQLLDMSKFPNLTTPKPVVENYLPFDNSRPVKIEYDGEIQYESIGNQDFRLEKEFTAFLKKQAPGLVDKISQDEGGIGELVSQIYEEESEDYDEANSTAGSKIGGHPCFAQWDPRDEKWSPDTQNLLFQLDSQYGICIGDVGVMNFFGAGPSTSMKGNFDGVKYNWDCG